MRRVLLGVAVLITAVAAGSCGGGGSSPSSPSPVAGTTSTSVATTTTTTVAASTTTTTVPGGATTTSVAASTTTTSTGVTVAYTQDVKPVLDADCVRCHSSSVRNGNVDLSSYTAVMRTVTPGSASSLLVRVTQSNGAMYTNFTGNRTTKAALIRSWVVDNGAAVSR